MKINIDKSLRRHYALTGLLRARPASLLISKLNVVRQDVPAPPEEVTAAEGDKPK